MSSYWSDDEQDFWQQPSPDSSWNETATGKNIPREALLSGIGTPYQKAWFANVPTGDPVVAVKLKSGRWQDFRLSKTSPCVLREIIRLIGRELAVSQLWKAVSKGMKKVQRKYPGFQNDALLKGYLKIVREANRDQGPDHGEKVYDDIDKLLRRYEQFDNDACQMSSRSVKNLLSRGRPVDKAYLDADLNVVMHLARDRTWTTVPFSDLRPCVLMMVLPHVAYDLCHPTVRATSLASLTKMKKSLRTFAMSTMLKSFLALVNELQINNTSSDATEKAVSEFLRIDFSEDAEICDLAAD